MWDGDSHATFDDAARKRDALGSAYLHIIESRIHGNELIAEVEPIAAVHLRPLFRGTLVAAGGFDGDSAEAMLEAGHPDVVAFGRAFIANPDLPECLRRTRLLNPYGRDTVDGGDTAGCIDDPFFERAKV